jgi:hypothetical protein
MLLGTSEVGAVARHQALAGKSGEPLRCRRSAGDKSTKPAARRRSSDVAIVSDEVGAQHNRRRSQGPLDERPAGRLARMDGICALKKCAGRSATGWGLPISRRGDGAKMAVRHLVWSRTGENPPCGILEGAEETEWMA